MKSLVRALHGRPFALLWSGQTISLLGDRLFQVALAWWVLEKTGSAVAMGTVFILSIAPMLLFLLVGGVLGDRFPRLRIMIASDLARGIIMGGTALLAFSDRLAIGYIYSLSLLFGFVDAFFQPAYRAAMPEVTPESDLTSANSLTSLSGQFAGIAGPAAGAAVVALGGTSLAFALDALSFFISVLCLLALARFLAIQSQPPKSLSDANPRPNYLSDSPLEERGANHDQEKEEAPSHEKPKVPGIFAEMREGLATVTGMPWLWVTIAVAGISNVAYSGPMEVALPFLLNQYHHANVEALGLFYSAGSVGAVLAALWMGRIRKLRHRGWMLYGSWLIGALMVMLIGLPIPIIGILGASLVIGACNSILSLVWVNSLQEVVPAHLLGRVSSVDYLGSFILLPVGYAVGGWGAQRVGAPLVFIIGGLCQTLLVALGLLHPKVRSMD